MIRPCISNCYHVYLDVGSNVGIQIRKLYEPHLFQNPVPAVAWWYDKLFGNVSRYISNHNQITDYLLWLKTHLNNKSEL